MQAKRRQSWGFQFPYSEKLSLFPLAKVARRIGSSSIITAAVSLADANSFKLSACFLPECCGIKRQDLAWFRHYILNTQSGFVFEQYIGAS